MSAGSSSVHAEMCVFNVETSRLLRRELHTKGAGHGRGTHENAPRPTFDMFAVSYDVNPAASLSNRAAEIRVSSMGSKLITITKPKI